MALNTDENFPPAGNPPYFINKEWCIGDSLDYINLNSDNFDTRIISVCSQLNKLSSDVINVSDLETSTIRFGYSYTPAFGVVLSADVKQQSLSTINLGGDITTFGKFLLTSTNIPLTGIFDVRYLPPGTTPQQFHVLAWDFQNRYWYNQSLQGLLDVGTSSGIDWSISTGYGVLQTSTTLPTNQSSNGRGFTYRNETVGTAALSARAVTTAKLDLSAVDTAQINNNAVTTSKLAIPLNRGNVATTGADVASTGGNITYALRDTAGDLEARNFKVLLVAGNNLAGNYMYNPVGNSIAFRTINTGAPSTATERLRINDDGVRSYTNVIVTGSVSASDGFYSTSGRYYGDDANDFLDINDTRLNIHFENATTPRFTFVGSTTRLGIGTTTPSTSLHINATDGIVLPVGTTAQRVATTGAIRYNSQLFNFEGFNGSCWGSLGGVIDVDRDTYISAEDSSCVDNDELKFFTAGSERMRILSSGNIGIGNTNPNQALTVTGNISAVNNIIVTGNLSATGNITTTSRAGIGNIVLHEALNVRGAVLTETVSYASNQNQPYLIAGSVEYTGATTDWGTYGIQHRLKSTSGGVPRITIDALSASGVPAEWVSIQGGNVGIGEINPLGTVSLFRPAGETASFSIQSAANSRFWISQPFATNVLAIGGNGTTNPASGAINITNTGLVGIGTTTPSYRLDVREGSLGVFNSSADSYIYLGEGTGANEYGFLQWDRTNNIFRAGTDTQTPFVLLTNNLERVRITSTGQVGIGITTPSGVLDLGAGNAGRAISWGGTATNYVNIWTSFSNGALVLGAGLRGSTSGTDSYVSPNNDTSLRRNAIRLNLIEDNGIQFFSNTNSAVTDGSAITPIERVRITPSGISINQGSDNTTARNAIAPLTFSNTATDKIDLWHTVGTGTGGDKYGFGVGNSELRIYSGQSGANEGGILFGNAGTTAFTETMRLLKNGNLGIGTTTPIRKLDVVGNARFSTGAELGNTQGYSNYELLLDFDSNVANTWRRIVSVGSPNAQYSAIGFKVEITDQQTNYATAGTPEQIIEETYYVACVRTGATTLNDPDACVVRGPGDRIRAIKVSQGNYEIHIQNAAQWREYRVKISVYGVNGTHSVTYREGDTPATAVATYAASTGGSSIERFLNVGVSNNLTVTGTTTTGNATVGTTLRVGPALTGSALGTTFNTNAGALGTTAGNILRLANIGFTSSNSTSLGIKAVRRADGTAWDSTAIALTYDVDNTAPVNNSQLVLASNGRVSVGTSASLGGRFSSMDLVGAGMSTNFLAQAPGTAQSQRVGIGFAPTFSGTGDNLPRRAADIVSGFTGGWDSPYLAIGVGRGLDSSTQNDTYAETDERFRVSAPGINGTVRISGSRATVNIETQELLRLVRPVTPSIKNSNSAGIRVGAFETGGNGRGRMDFMVSGTPAAGNTFGEVPDITVMTLLGNGFVGVGSTAPSTKFELSSNGASYSSPTTNDLATIKAVNTKNDSVNAHAILSLNTTGANGGDPFISFDVNGVAGWSLGLDNSDSDNFKIAGNWNDVGTAAYLTIIRATGAALFSNDITAFSSDKRLKENIEIIPNALDKVNKLTGFTYNFNALGESFNFKQNKRHAGVFAQEVQSVLPEAVTVAPFDRGEEDENGNVVSKTGNNYLTVQYDKLVPLLIEAIKELSQEVKELKSKIKE